MKLAFAGTPEFARVRIGIGEGVGREHRQNRK